MIFSIFKAIPLVTTAISGLNKYLDERALLKKISREVNLDVKKTRIRAKARQKIKKIEANTSISLKLIEQTASSFKDELILLCAIALFVVACIPSLQPEIKAGFTTLKEMPDYLQYIFSAVFLSALGIQVSKVFKGK